MTPQAETVRGLFATLVAGGVRHVIVSPGSRSTPLVQAAAERPELTLHVVLDERSAGFYALGLVRTSRGLVATLCTSGSAAAHVLPAAIEATESGDTLVAITADRPARVRGLGAPQAIVQPGLLAPYAVHFAEIDALEPDVADRLAALHQALCDVPQLGGVLHVNVPLALPLALPPGTPAPLPPPLQPTSRPDLAAIPAPQPNERVLVLAGPLPDCDAGALHAILANPQIVFAAEPASRMRHLELGIQNADALLRDPEVRAALLPDRIVRLGAWPVSKGMQLLLEDAKQLAIPVDVVHPRRFSDPLTQNRATLVGDLANALRLWPTATQASASGWSRLWRAADAAVEAPALAWTEASAVAVLARALPAPSALLIGNSMAIRDWDTFAPRLPATIHVEVSRGAAGIDGAVATLAGLAAGRKQPVTAYLGDCTFLHDIGSLQLLTHGQLQHQGIRICIADNDGGAIFDYLPARAHLTDALHRACFTTPHGQDLAGIAAGFGCDVDVCASLDEWQAALAKPLVANRTHVVVARFAREASEEVHRAYWREAAHAARRAVANA